MLSTKNYKNNSSIYANTGKFDKLECDEAEISNYPSISYINSNYYNKSYIDTLSGRLLNNYYIKADVDSIIGGTYSTIMFRLDEFHYTRSQMSSLYYEKSYINTISDNFIMSKA